MLRFLIVTYNQAGGMTSDINKLLMHNEIDHHIIAIGTQESVRSIKNSFCIESKRKWENVLM